MFSFAADYFITVLVAALGVIQLAASLGRLDGLLILKSKLLTRGLGLALVPGAFAWFFSTGTRNINDFEGGLDANEQALLLFLATLTAVAVTFLVSSIVNARMRGPEPAPGEGLDALRRTSYARALILSIRYWSKEWRTQIRSYLLG